jgi:hypothetical protein
MLKSARLRREVVMSRRLMEKMLGCTRRNHAKCSQGSYHYLKNLTVEVRPIYQFRLIQKKSRRPEITRDIGAKSLEVSRKGAIEDQWCARSEKGGER